MGAGGETVHHAFMRIALARTVGSAAPLLGAATGAFVAVQGHVGAPVGRATAAACASDLPATAARCTTDHAVADVGPFVVPALLGGVVGLVAAIVALVMLGWVGRVRPGRADHPVGVTVPSWVVLPRSGSEASGRASGPGG